MYDMYPWGATADGPRARAPKPRSAEANGEATAAVQVALDRRDCGGEAADAESGAVAAPSPK
jgi:hypothetical protein